MKLVQDSDRSRPISGYQTCLIICVIRVTLLLMCAELKHFAYGFSQESMRSSSGAKTDFPDSEPSTRERNMTEFISETLNEEKVVG